MYPTNEDLEAMKKAIESGETATVRQLIDTRFYAGKTVIDRLEQRTALHLAAIDRQADICRLLLKRDADIAARDSGGNTTLHLSTGSGGSVKEKTEICRMLIASGAEVDAKNNDGRTPLFYAAIIGDLEICKMLIDHGAEVRVADNNGSTPLHWAARSAHFDVCKLLIEFGADAMAPNNKGVTPLHDVCSRMSEERVMPVVEMLLREGASASFIPDNPQGAYLTPFQSAVAIGRECLVRHFVVNCGEDPNQKALDGRSMIEVASLYEDEIRPVLLSLTTEWAVRKSVAEDEQNERSFRRSSSGMSML